MQAVLLWLAVERGKSAGRLGAYSRTNQSNEDICSELQIEGAMIECFGTNCVRRRRYMSPGTQVATSNLVAGVDVGVVAVRSALSHQQMQVRSKSSMHQIVSSFA